SEGRGSGAEHEYVVVRRGADGTPDAAPSAIVKLSGMNVDWDATDFDHDGVQDVVATRVDVPTGLTSLANVRLDAGTYLFHGGKGGTIERDPGLKLERTFRPDQLTRVQESLLTNWSGDFDGDGLNDLVLTQIDGRVEVQKLVRQGDGFAFADAPLASFSPP